MQVGSATTILVERMRTLAEAEAAAVAGGAAPQLSLSLTETEATLFALGIRADTGVLSFPATTARDAQALAWLMERGCSQSAIAEFGQAHLEPALEPSALSPQPLTLKTSNLHPGPRPHPDPNPNTNTNQP